MEQKCKQYFFHIFPRHSLTEKSNLLSSRNKASRMPVKHFWKKEQFDTAESVPSGSYGNRSFTPNPELSPSRVWFTVRKMHIIFLLSVILFIGILLTLHSRHFPREPNRTNHTASNYTIEESKDIFPHEHLQPDISSDKPATEIGSTPSALTKESSNDNSVEMRETPYSAHLIQPILYKIYIQLPHVQSIAQDQNIYHGNVSITLRCKEKIHNIIIAANDLKIVTVKLKSLQKFKDAKEYYTSINSYDVEHGTLIIHVYEGILPKVKYLLEIEFIGNIKQMPYGIFQITTDGSDTENIGKTIIASNTDVPFARTIFPCFDLQTQAASYQIHICRDANLMAETSSDYLTSSVDRASTCVWETFKSTDTMPLHVFGFVISDFYFKTVSMIDSKKFYVWSPYDTNDDKYALKIGPKIVETLSLYFQTNLPVAHIDLYSIPAEFPYIKSKWGIIMTKETEVLVKDGTNTENEKEQVLITLTSHLIEQWMGFVNFEDDHDMWLKDSIVQYLQYVIADMVEPTWNLMDKLINNIYQNELDTDILNSHKKPLKLHYMRSFKRKNKYVPLFPIKETSVFSSHTDYTNILKFNKDEGDVINPDIYSEIYDRKSMDKGMCILRMFHHIVTDAIFRKSLNKFIEISKNIIVTNEDYWNLMALEVANSTTVYTDYEIIPPDVPLNALVNEWIYAKEYPVLLVTRDYTKNNLQFTQVTSPDEWNSPKKPFRYIPISYTTQSDSSICTAPRFWLKNVKQITVSDLSGVTNDTWILINPMQTNLYRVIYDAENLNMISKSLKTRQIPAQIRAQLLDDMLFLARRNILNYEFVLQFTIDMLLIEKEYIVWFTAFHHFQHMKIILDNETEESYVHYRNIFQEFLIKVIRPVYNLIMKRKEQATNTDGYQLSHTEIQLHTEISLWACEVGLAECVKAAKANFRRWKREFYVEKNFNDLMSLLKLRDPKTQYEQQNNTERKISNIHYVTICNGLRFGDESDFEFVYHKYSNTSSMSPYKYTYLKSLYCYRDINKVISKILSDTLLNEYSLSQLKEVSNIWQALIERPIPSTAPFDYVLIYWKSILKRYSNFIPIMRNIIEGATINIHYEEQMFTLIKLKEDIYIRDSYKLPEILHYAIKHIQQNILWKKNGLPKLLSSLEKIHDQMK